MYCLQCDAVALPQVASAIAVAATALIHPVVATVALTGEPGKPVTRPGARRAARASAAPGAAPSDRILGMCKAHNDLR
jgi:hypothetical protein